MPTDDPGLTEATQRVEDVLRADSDNWRALALRLARAAREDVADRIQQARADAWDEGYAASDHEAYHFSTHGRTDNPHRAAAIREAGA